MQIQNTESSVCYLEAILNNNRIDDAVLALLYLGRHEVSRMSGEVRTWKSFDWNVMERLYEKGLISNPINKNKAVAFTDEGLKESELDLQSHEQE